MRHYNEEELRTTRYFFEKELLPIPQFSFLKEKDKLVERLEIALTEFKRPVFHSYDRHENGDKDYDREDDKGLGLLMWAGGLRSDGDISNLLFNHSSDSLKLSYTHQKGKRTLIVKEHK
jgi:hypothetical protein